MTTVVQAVIDEQNPWPGLASFDEAAKRFFNGRRNESAEFRRLVLNAPLTVLFGASGLGKTSLVQAGLFPLLRKEHYLPVYVRLDLRDHTAPLIDQVKDALKAQLEARLIDSPGMRDDESLWCYLHRAGLELWSKQNQLLTPVFVFDQFEEVFTLGAENPAAVTQLRIDLADLIENRLPTALAATVRSNDAVGEAISLDSQRYKVVLSFREDFLPAVEGWKRDMPSILRNRLRLLPMSGEQAFEAVYKTASNLVDEPTARQIVRFVAAAQDGIGKGEEVPEGMTELAVEPALLSLVCSGLNEKRKTQGKSAFDVELLAGSGQSIIADYYNGAVRDMPERAQRFIENELITERGFRKPCDVDDARSVHGITDQELHLLVDRRVLRIVPQRGAEQVELTHDLLTRVVREHRDRERERTKVRRQRKRMSVFGAVGVVLAGLAVVFFLLYLNAVQQSRKAQRAQIAALESEKDALQEKRRAEESSQTALANANKAIKSGQAAEKALSVSRAATKRAESSEQKLRFETMRMRERILEASQIQVKLSEELASLSPPERAYVWHDSKAMALLEQGNLALAVEEEEKAVAGAPDSVQTRANRGYAYTLNSEPAKALQDFDYVEKIDPLMASNHVRRAVILALLERSAEARQALDKAIKYFSYADSVLSQLEISPDIQLATGRTALYASPDAQRVALHYLRALFSAYVGASDFASELAGADEAARVVMPSIREDAYVMALNWGWLQEKKKKEGRPDYGAEVGEGALWERLGFPEWAACYYQTFEDQHHKLHDNRYDQLAKWANQRLAGLGHREPHVCGRLRTLPSDPRALELEARESSNQKYYEKAQADINKAIEKQSNNIELLLLRADIRMNLAIKANQAIVAANAEINKAQDELNKVKKGSSAESGLSGAASREAKPMSPAEVQAAKDKLRDTIIKDSTDAQQQEKNRTEAWEGIKADSETIIKLDPNTADAYFWRGVAYSWLRKPEEPYEPVLKDFRKALSLNVTHPGVLNELSNLPAQDKNARWAALGYAKDFNRFYPGYGFAREAKLHNQLKQFSFAVDAIEHAIAVDGTDLNNYDIRAESERGLGLDEQAVSRRLAEGYFQAGDILKQRGNTEQAYAAFEKAWVVLGKTQGSASQTKMRCNSNVTVCEKTEVIHSYGAAVVSVITEVQAGEGMVRIVKVNRGSEDGLTMGAQGELFSSYGKADGSTRDLNQIGRAEVLGVDSHSAIVEIKMDKPSGDGLARPGDIVQVPGFLK